MNPAYNKQWLDHLALIKETKNWANHSAITDEQYEAIKKANPVGFYHPNFVIQILLFIASLIAISGITGILGLGFIGAFNDDEVMISVACIIYGVVSLVVLELTFIRKSNHYKSGVNEAILYHSILFTVGGIGGATDFDFDMLCIVGFIAFLLASIRYLDVLTTVSAIATMVVFIFYKLGENGLNSIVPFVFMAVFLAVFLVARRLRNNQAFRFWGKILLLVEVVSLLLLYCSGNYLVVRELSVGFLGLAIEPGEDLPFAWLFYLFTSVIPVALIAIGIWKRDVVFLRVSLLVIAFSAFTFNYYHGFDQYEFALLAAGAILVPVSILLIRYLHIARRGFVSDKFLSTRSMSDDAQAFIISQTLGGNQATTESAQGGGGEFGGGGSSGTF